MTMNKNVVEGLKCNKLLTKKQRKKCREAKNAVKGTGKKTINSMNILSRNENRLGVDNTQRKNQEATQRKVKSRWQRWLYWNRIQKIRAKKLFKYTKAELSKLEKELDAAQNRDREPGGDPIKELKKNAQKNLDDAQGISREVYVDINKLKELDINTQKILENAKMSGAMMVSMMDFAKNGVFKKIDKIQNILNKRKIRRYIPKSDVLDVESRAKDLKSGIINYFDVKVYNMKDDIDVIDKITLILKEYYYNAAKEEDKKNANYQQNT